MAYSLTWNQLKRPNTIRFRPDYHVTPDEVYYAANKELEAEEVKGSIKCIAQLNTGWFNVSFDSEAKCQRIALRGLKINGILINCERTNIHNSVVVYIKATYEMSDQTVTAALSEFGIVTNIRRQTYDFDRDVENGVRSSLIKSIKKPIPSFIKVGNYNLPINHRGQVKTCRRCNRPGALFTKGTLKFALHVLCVGLACTLRARLLSVAWYSQKHALTAR